MRYCVDGPVYQLDDPLHPEYQMDNVSTPEDSGHDDRVLSMGGFRDPDMALYRHLAEKNMSSRLAKIAATQADSQAAKPTAGQPYPSATGTVPVGTPRGISEGTTSKSSSQAPPVQTVPPTRDVVQASTAFGGAEVSPQQAQVRLQGAAVIATGVVPPAHYSPCPRCAAVNIVSDVCVHVLWQSSAVASTCCSEGVHPSLQQHPYGYFDAAAARRARITIRCTARVKQNSTT